jgi:5-deoxy-glucuronate isomerase
MFEKLSFNNNNERIVCEMNGKHSDMLMNIKVKRFNPGDTFSLCDNDCETAFLILYGDADITWNGETKNMFRENPFVKASFCLHVPKETEVTIKANKETEILIQQTDNDIIFSPVFYTPEMILYQHFGKFAA